MILWPYKSDSAHKRTSQIRTAVFPTLKPDFSIDAMKSEFKTVRVWARSRDVSADVHYSICSDSHSPNLRAAMQRRAVLGMRRTAAAAPVHAPAHAHAHELVT